MSCIRKAEVGICLVFWFKSKDVALVIGDEAQAGSEKSPASLDQEGMSQDQGMCMLVAIVLQATNGADIELGQPGTDQCQVVYLVGPRVHGILEELLHLRLAVAQVLVVRLDLVMRDQGNPPNFAVAAPCHLDLHRAL